jgi:hypothetical protein
MQRFISKSLLTLAVGTTIVSQSMAQGGPPPPGGGANMNMTTDYQDQANFGFDTVMIDGLTKLPTPGGSTVWGLMRRTALNLTQVPVTYGAGPGVYTASLLQNLVGQPLTIAAGTGPMLFYPGQGPTMGNGNAWWYGNVYNSVKGFWHQSSGPRFYQFYTEYSGIQYFGTQCGPASVSMYNVINP